MFDTVRLRLHTFIPPLRHILTTALPLQREFSDSVVAGFCRFVHVRQDVFSIVLLLRQSAVIHLVQVRFAPVEIGAVVLDRERVFEIVDVVVQRERSERVFGCVRVEDVADYLGL